MKPDPTTFKWACILNLGKWGIVFLVGYFMLSPVAGLYRQSSPSDVLAMCAIVASLMGLDVPQGIWRAKMWEKKVDEALRTEPPKEPPGLTK